MKTVREIMKQPPIWVNPGHTVKTACLLMQGHGMFGLPVVKGDEVIGVVNAVNILGMENDVQIAQAMISDFPTVHPDMPLREAAELFAKGRYNWLPVIDESVLVGMLEVYEMLVELGRSYDPMTKLPWSDSLREWAIEELIQGREITIIFFDLNDFGKFNKRFGHLVGDLVLQLVSKALLDGTNPSKDIVCRYGGDELCVGTVRRSDEAATLANRLSDTIREIRIPQINMPISATFGYAGGRRTRERLHTHYMATVDDLINRASRECEEMKIRPESEIVINPVTKPIERIAVNAAVNNVEPDDTESKTISIKDFQSKYDSGWLRADLHVAIGNKTFSGQLTSPVTREQDMIELVAQLTVNTIIKAMPDTYKILAEDIMVETSDDSTRRVFAKVRYISPEEDKMLAGMAIIGKDISTAVVTAVISALCDEIAKLQTSI